MSTPLLSTSKWTPIGPAPIDTQGGLDQISGRIQAAATDPTNPATIYLGSDNGGIWKNINSPSWTPLTDAMPSPALGANFGQSFGAYHTLVVHPANPDLVLGLVSGLGAGILQSNDGGNTWQLLANSQFNGKGLNSLAVHPTVPKTMYLSAGGFGAWTSNDGGVTWLRTRQFAFRKRVGLNYCKVQLKHPIRGGSWEHWSRTGPKRGLPEYR